jgi:ribonuclease Z
MLAAEINLAGLVLSAISSGGVETCYQVPSYDLNLDIGRAPPGSERQSRLLLTHGHIDHAAGLPYYVSLRGLVGFAPPMVHCPHAAIGPVKKIMEGWAELQSDSERCALIGVGPGDRIPLGADRFAHCFATPHRIATIGYTLFKKARKLRPELVGEPPSAIAERARRGEIVNVELERPELCFPGDARIEVVDREPTVTEAKVLLLECTFLGPTETPEKASRGGHIHLAQIAERASLFKNEAIVLTHFSRRYPAELIQSEVARLLPEALLARTWLLLHESPTGPGRLVAAFPGTPTRV